MILITMTIGNNFVFTNVLDVVAIRTKSWIAPLLVTGPYGVLLELSYVAYDDHLS